MALIIYFSFGHEYIHAPAPYQFVIFLVCTAGTAWFLISGVLYMIRKTDSQLGYLIVSGINTLIFVGGMYLLLYPPFNTESTEELSDEISIEHRGDSTLMFHNSNLIYVEIGDSVILDLKNK